MYGVHLGAPYTSGYSEARGVGWPEAGLKGTCEPTDVGAGNPMQVLWKSS